MNTAQLCHAIVRFFCNFKTIAYNIDVHSLSVLNLSGGETYSKAVNKIFIYTSWP